MVWVADRHSTSVIEQADELAAVTQLPMVNCVLDEHLPIAKEGRCDGVVCVLEMLRLLVGGEEAPAQEAGARLAIAVVVRLQSVAKGPELGRLYMHISDSLQVLFRFTALITTHFTLFDYK